MSESDREIRRFPDWLITEEFVTAASSARILNQKLEWREPDDFLGAYRHEDGYVLAVPNEDGEYIYSSVTIEKEEGQ